MYMDPTNDYNTLSRAIERVQRSFTKSICIIYVISHICICIQIVITVQFVINFFLNNHFQTVKYSY